MNALRGSLVALLLPLALAGAREEKKAANCSFRKSAPVEAPRRASEGEAIPRWRVGLPGCQTGEGRAKAPASPSATARALVEALAKEEFAKAGKDFDATMNKALPEAELRKMWKALLGKVGALRKQGSPRIEKAGGYDIVYVPCEFEKMALDFRIPIDKDGKVAGLRFVDGGNFAFKPPSYARPATFSEREVVVGAEGKWRLPGTLTLPKGAGPFPAVVLVHGSGPHDRDETIGPNKPFRDLAWGLATQGIVVLRYVKRTKEHGKRMVLEKSVTIKEEVIEDALEAVALLRKQKEVDPKRVFVVGHSLGANVAPRIGMEAVGVAGLVLLAGNSRPLEDLVLEQYTYLFSLEGKLSDENKARLEKIKKQVAKVKGPKLSADTPAAELALGAPATYWLALRAHDPLATAQRFKKPMLILQGERDYQVTMADLAGWKKALAGRKDVTFKSYPRLNHLFMVGLGGGKSTPSDYLVAGHVAKDVVDDVAAWVKKP